MAYAAGNLDRRIQISKYTGNPTAIGSRRASYSLIGWVWANYKHVTLKKAELIQGGQWQGESYATFTIRYRTDFGVKDQITFNGLEWDIQEITPYGMRNEFLQLTCKARRTK